MSRDIALLDNVTQRVTSLVGANPGIWANSVSGNVGAFPDMGEITTAALEADGELIVKGYLNSINDTLSQPFLAMSDPIANGGNVPMHYGNAGKVELAQKRILLATTNIDTSADLIDITAGGKEHRLATGAAVTLTVGSGTLPAPLVKNTTYYVIVLSAYTFGLATTLENAWTGVKIDLTTTGSGSFWVLSWEPGVEVKRSTVADILASTTEYLAVDTTQAKTLPTRTMGFFYCLENGNLYHTSSHGRVEVPGYTRTLLLQANKVDETLIIAGTMRNLTKNASPAAFKEWTDIWDQGLQQIIRDGSYQPMDQAAQAGDQNP